MTSTSIYDGPVSGKADEAAKDVEQWTLQGADVIAVSANDPACVLADAAMKFARNKGTHVITWDADAAKDTQANSSSTRRRPNRSATPSSTPSPKISVAAMHPRPKAKSPSSPPRSPPRIKTNG